MGNQRVALEIIEDFLAKKRIAMVGLSRQPKDFSVMLFKELCRRGYDVVPVNPGAAEVMGGPASPACRTSSLRFDGVLLMTSPTANEAVVEDCAEAASAGYGCTALVIMGRSAPRPWTSAGARGIQVVPGRVSLHVFSA